MPDGAQTITNFRVEWPQPWEIAYHQLREYKRCSLRFFFTHVLGLRSASKATPSSRTQDSLYDLIRWTAATRPDGCPPVAEILKKFHEIWQVKGPVDHAYAEEYKQIALEIVNVLIATGEGYTFQPSESLPIELDGGRITVRPDEIAVSVEGKITLRRIRTGHKRVEEYDDLEYALYALAGRARFGDDLLIRALHLADRIDENVPIDPTVMAKNRQASQTILADIRAGKFRAKLDPFVCPRCPHFFICPATPKGELKLS